MRNSRIALVYCVAAAAVAMASCSIDQRSALSESPPESDGGVIVQESKALYDCSASEDAIVDGDVLVARYGMRALRRLAVDTTQQNWLRMNMVAPGFGNPGITSDIEGALDVIESTIIAGFDKSCNRPYCDSNTNAFVVLPRKINLCAGYFSSPRRYRASVIVHETSHNAISSEDFFYDCAWSEVHNLSSRNAAYSNVRDNVQDFYTTGVCGGGSANPSCSGSCGACDRCVLPHRNGEWWEAATALALGIDIGGIFSSNRGTEPSQIEFESELERIATNGEDPYLVSSCSVLKMYTTWSQPARPSMEWWDALSLFRTFAHEANPSDPCGALDSLFSVGESEGFTFTSLHDGLVLPTPDGDIVFGRTGTLHDYLRYMSTHSDLVGAGEYFRGVSTSLTMSVIGM